ncbi:MAG: hypothetical protein WKG00_34650 [Polyangiaceae bacterium]
MSDERWERTGRRHLAAPWMLHLAVAVASALLAGCNGKARVHTFVAQRYHADADCLDGGAVVDVIEGSDPGRCPRIQCWVSSAEEVYITTEACDAPLDYRDGTSDEAPSACASALAAQALGEDGLCPR